MTSEYKEPEFLRLIFSDILGHLKSIEVGYDRLNEILEHGAVIDGSSVKGYASVNESDLLLLSSCATPIHQPWDPSAAFLLCRVHETSRKPHPRDPRNVLDTMVRKAANQGFQLMLGSELEFFAIRRGIDESVEPRDAGGYFSTRPTDPELDFRREVIRTLNTIGIATTSHHHEVARGQHEIGLHYAPAATAADNILLARQVIVEMASMKGIDVTFMPKPFSDQNGSGLHLHQSIWDVNGSRNLFASQNDGGLSHLAVNYVGGLLEYASSYVALLAPTVNSYKRLIPGFEAPIGIAWGYRNRSTMIRVPHFNGSAKAARIELRCPDTTISPHLGIAAIIAAGLEGIMRSIEPPEPTQTNLYKSSTEVDSLPCTLKESLLLLKEDQILRKELGESVIDTFVSLRMKEWEQYVEATENPHSSDITSWELEKYLHAN